ncbi:hypothetical protein [Chondromyces crocatus]|uniref:Uncharacterized protein n=1 Tax=Chondromyces crocatus TaxID=52 RepID=A0A0K1EH26_CHOCO|nr:hypothetical protein [Chondromyces crocatus]AKT40149.1 uncharacterized protein CMC5_043020 [Chondromyces crocatus]
MHPHGSPIRRRRLPPSSLLLSATFCAAGIVACGSSPDQDPSNTPPTPTTPTPTPEPPRPDRPPFFPLPEPEPPPTEPPTEPPGHRVDAPIMGPATGAQEMPAVAFNGATYFAVWADSRPVKAYGARVDPSGAVLDASASLPLPLATRFLDVAASGEEFVVVGQQARPSAAAPSPGLVALRIGPNGDLLGTSVITSALDTQDVKIAGSPSGYLVVWQEVGDDVSDPRPIRRARIAPDGTVLDPMGVVLDGDTTVLTDVAFDGTSYVVAWSRRTPSSGRWATLDTAGNLIDDVQLPDYPRAMACHDGRCGVVWGGDHDLSFSWMKPEGTPVSPQPIPFLSDFTDDGRLAVGFAGESAIVAWSRGRSEGLVDRMGMNIIPLDGPPVLANGSAFRQRAGDPALAWDGNHAFLAWSDDRHGKYLHLEASIFAARVTKDAVVLDAEDLLVSRSANAQTTPTLTFDGQDYVLAWSDDRNAITSDHTDIFAGWASPGGDLVDLEATAIGVGASTQTSPRASFDGTATTFAWWDCVHNVDGSDCYLQGSRITGSSQQPLHFPYFHYVEPRTPPALSSAAGTTVVAAFRDDTQLVTATVDANGVHAPAVTEDGPMSTRLASAFDGTNHFVAWIQDVRDPGPLLGARVAADGTVLDLGGLPLTPAGTQARSFSLAHGGGMYLLAWHDTTTPVSRILATRIGTDGVVLDAAPLVVAEHPACPALGSENPFWADGSVNLGTAGVAFDGTHFVLGWRTCGPVTADLRGALVSVDGVVRARFQLTEDAHADEAPTLASTVAGQTLFTYASFRAAPPLGTWRLFMQRIDTGALAP